MFYRFTLIILCFSLIMSLAQEEVASEETWQNIGLVNVKTAESFTLADFKGKAVFVEPMATWCSNCRRQLNNLMAAKAQLNTSEIDEENEYVFVALSIEGNLANERLAQYAQKEGFEFTFAVASEELIRELVATFGRSVTNPPITPHFIIKPDGTYTGLETGLESTEELVSQLVAARAQNSESIN